MNSKNIWISKEERKSWQEEAKREQARTMWGPTEEEKNRPKPEDYNVKIAWVEVNGIRRMLGVDNETMQGYEMEENIPTWKRPLVPTSYDKFVRWCTTFDV